MRTSVWQAWAAVGVLFAATAASAHHSVAGEFQTTQRATLTGVISKIDWINPHTYVHLDVVDENGEVTSWRLESLPTAMMRKAGMTPEKLMGGGGKVTANTMLARDGTKHLAYLLKLTYADGHYIQFAGE
jgi:Family of unknown function (DUF6152)